MKAVILAAGEGVRMRPLTESRPKPLLEVGGKPLLEHLLDALPAEVNEVIIVVGYLGQQIIDRFGNQYGGRKLSYVWQVKKEGTYRALELCKSYLTNGPFLVMYADDLFDEQSIHALIGLHQPAVLVARHENPQKFGVIEVDERGYVRGIEEKPTHPKSNLVNCGPMVLTPAIFDFPSHRHPNGEYYLTDSVSQMLATIPLRVSYAQTWIPIGYPEDLVRAEELLKMHAWGSFSAPHTDH